MSRSVFASNRDSFQAIYPGRSQRLSVGGSSTQSLSLLSATTIVELFATTDCWVVFGANPTASVNDGSSFFLAAGLFKCYGVQPGVKIAVMQDSTSGDLHIIEGSV